jgi:Wadjet protein JetD, C-terminal
VTMPASPEGADLAGVGPLARALGDLIVGSRKSRIDIATLRERAHQVDLSLAGNPDARTHLADAIIELHEADLVTLPRGSRSWDRTVQPPLPNYVQRTRSADQFTAPAPLIPEPAWNAQLSWVPEFLAQEQASSTERRLLLAVQAFLAQGTPARTVPMRERSLKLLQNEKALDSLIRGRLFTEGRLTLELLAAERVVPPLVAAETGAGPDVLVVENYSTFVSVARALTGHGIVGQVIWGAGNQVTQLLPQLPAILGEGQLLYFGDLDIRGLEIGAAATATSSELGLPPAQPSADLYALLLEHGQPAPLDSGTPSQARIAQAVRWLPASLRTPTANVLGGGLRLAQEAVGTDLLAIRPPPTPLR